MTEKTTACECPLAGYCNRHSMRKSPHYHHLCQTNQKYFDQWEQCKGVGQEFTECAKNSQDRVQIPIVYPEKKSCQQCNRQEPKIVQEDESQKQLKENLPSLWQQAKNFTGEAVKHVSDGMKKTEEDLKKERLEICNGCEFLIKDQKRCGKCGCFVEVKTKWASASCPIGKW